MTSAGNAETAQAASARFSTDRPWEVFGQRLRRYEVYFDGPHVETVRGPILVEGVGLRLFRPTDAAMGIGFQATTDLSDRGLVAMKEEAERLTTYSTFPAAQVHLPTSKTSKKGAPDVVDPALWADPVGTVQGYVAALLAAFPSSGEPTPSFGSVKATLIENSLANSEGLSVSFPETTVELEIAVKSFGGPEGRPPGEYWLTREMRRLDAHALPGDVATWCQRAQDVRRAKQPPSGTLPVGLPSALLSEILPAAMGGRFSGSGRLRKFGVEPGSRVAHESVTVTDDPTLPWGVGSYPLDDEGSTPRPIHLIEKGVAKELFYDCLHAGAFQLTSNGAASRVSEFGRRDWLRFAQRPTPSLATVSIAPGSGGSETEILENVEEGIWVDQLGWPNPDSISSGFGGEIRIGYRIQRGKLTEPVRGGTMGGLTFGPPGTPSLLGSVRAIGSRAVLVGRVDTPPMVVDGLTVSGEG